MSSKTAVFNIQAFGHFIMSQQGKRKTKFSWLKNWKFSYVLYAHSQVLCSRVANLDILKPDFEILAFLEIKKDWTCVISMVLTSFNVYFVCGCPCFMCICLKSVTWLFLVKTGWQPCCVVQQDSILQTGVCASQSSRTPTLDWLYSTRHSRSLILRL